MSLSALTCFRERRIHQQGGYWLEVRRESLEETVARRERSARRTGALIVLQGPMRPVFRWRWL